MEYQFYKLENGIRLIHKYDERQVAHCGIIINTGSRDETEEENGIAHFIEHVIFKGTKKRKAYHILSRLEDVGADLNAYTTKEETCIYASFVHGHYDRALELFSDITFNSIFPAKELEKEKDVVLDEIDSYKDSPSEEIFDEFEEVLFDGHPIARNILGTPQHVKTFKKTNIQNFIKNNYHTDQMVISSIGNIDFNKLVKFVEKHFAHIPKNFRSKQRELVKIYTPTFKDLQKKTHLSHCLYGNIAYKRDHEYRLGLVLLNNLLGGPGLNSRLNLAIREKHGYTYSIESNYQPYSDTGVFCVYLGSAKGYMDKSLKLVDKELKKLREQKLGTMQLKKAKQQIIGQVAISLESNLNEMLSIGKSILQINRVDTINDLLIEIDALKAEQLLEIANTVFDPKQMSTLIYRGGADD